MSRPLANKLYIREGYRIAILNPPVGYNQLLGELPDNVTVANSLEGEFDVIQFFVTKRKKLEEKLSGLSDALRSRGLVWVTYPKGNQLDADINRDSIFADAETKGLKAVAQVSVDGIWWALRLNVVG